MVNVYETTNWTDKVVGEERVNGIHLVLRIDALNLQVFLSNMRLLRLSSRVTDTNNNEGERTI